MKSLNQLARCPLCGKYPLRHTNMYDAMDAPYESPPTVGCCGVTVRGYPADWDYIRSWNQYANDRIIGIGIRVSIAEGVR